MPYTLTKVSDGDNVLGKWRCELVNLQPAISDYATGGYNITGIAGTTETTGNVGIAKVLFVWPVGGQGGWSPVWNPTTSKLQVFADSSSNGASPEANANTNLAAYTFELLVVGY